MLTCCSNGLEVRGQKPIISADNLWKKMLQKCSAQIGTSDFNASIFSVLSFDIDFGFNLCVFPKRPIFYGNSSGHLMQILLYYS